ncbi:MAG: type II secretion system protein GspG [Phycisphaerales bacterium]
MTATASRKPHRPMAASSAPLSVARRGFSLLEIMLVVLIMGILASVTILALQGRLQTARIDATKVKMTQIKNALLEFNGRNGVYPDTLQPLFTGANRYLQEEPKDEWRNAFVYRYPGSSSDPERSYDLISAGPDRQFGTADDLDLWTMNNPAQ